MITLMGMGIGGWLLALLAGFVLGGLFFISIRLQVEYVMKEQKRLWLLPACMYARLALVAAILVLVAIFVPSQMVAAAMLSGVAGVFIARLVISRAVRRHDDPDQAEETSQDA